jgi:serine/threonine protein kinase
MPDFETTFLAIASKNNFLTHEEAAEILAEFNAQAPGGARRGIQEICADRGVLTAQQILTLAGAAQRIVAPPPAPAAPAPPASSTTRRIPAAAPPPAAPARPANPNEPIPGIRIVGKLGVGGTATVFLAEDTKHRRKAALKIMHPSLAKDEKAVRRFQRESALLVSFDHPNIVKGYAQGMMGPLSWLLMEFLEGESAQEALDREGRFTEARSLEIVEEAAKGVDYMQSRGIIHRDIKPGNIFLLKDGRVKVIDLGFAQEIGAEAGADEETTSGTVQYMSPEQARGQRDLDVRADIYSLGATLYHMVMGQTPFSGSDSLEVMAKQVMESLNSGGMKNQRVSRHMHYFIERMMSKDKELRYSTPRELAEDITEQIEGFRSLEYKADESANKTSIQKAMNPGKEPPAGIPPRTTRRIPVQPPPTTRKFSRLDEFKRRKR